VRLVAEYTTVLDATEASLRAAKHLTPMDDGAIEALRALAHKIDTDDALRGAYLDLQVGGDRPVRPLQLDNVSIPTYLKYAESLGLTPAGREKLAAKPAAPKGKLGELRAVRDSNAG